MELVYETLNGPDGRRAVVLWIDDTAIGQRWLTATAMMFVELTRPTKDQSHARQPDGAHRRAKRFRPIGEGLQVDLPLLASERGGAPAEIRRTCEC